MLLELLLLLACVIGIPLLFLLHEIGNPRATSALRGLGGLTVIVFGGALLLALFLVSQGIDVFTLGSQP